MCMCVVILPHFVKRTLKMKMQAMQHKPKFFLCSCEVQISDMSDIET